MIIRALILTLCLSFPFSLHATDEASPARIAANNSAKLRASVGQTATVVGRVNSSSVSRSGHHFLNFSSSELTVICFKQHVGNFGKGGPAKEFKNKRVEVTGKLELYKGKPQIKLVGPEQIKLAPVTGSGGNLTPRVGDDRTTAPSRADLKVGETPKSKTKFELKQVGKWTWLSPAGLKYTGKDPEGRTRVEHVLRHAHDEPRRAGPHGVFDGGNDQALAIIDEAWKLAQKKKIKPKEEGRTSAYTIPMGRRVGYLGGQTGARRKNPSLKKVFIVVRTNTSEVITAFPK